MNENVIRETLTNESVRKLSVKDIYFISMSDSGAMGDGGAVCIISLKGQKIIIQRGNYVYNDLDINQLYHKLPFLVKLHSDKFDKIENWHFEYMGAGNNLLIRNDIYDDFMATTENFEIMSGVCSNTAKDMFVRKLLKSVVSSWSVGLEKMNDLYAHHEAYAIGTLQNKLKKG